LPTASGSDQEAARRGDQRRQCRFARLFLPPFAYSELQIPGGAIAATKPLGDDKLAECMHSHPLHTIEGNIAVGPHGEWTKAQPIWVQYHGIRGSMSSNSGDRRPSRSWRQRITRPAT
jgi:hypothetical protein